MKNVKFNIIPDEKSDAKSAIVFIEGDLTLRNANGLKQEFVALKDKYNAIEITIENASTLDLSTLQLLVAIQKSFLAEGKKIKINLNLSDETRKLIQQAGFSKIVEY